MADKKPTKIIGEAAKQPAAAPSTSHQEKKKIPAKFFDVEAEKKESLSWKTFIIPGFLVIILIGFFVGEKLLKGKGKFPEPENTVTAFILEVKNLPVVRDKKVVVPNPAPDLTQFFTEEDKKWFLDSYKKLAFVAVGRDVKAYNFLNDDEKKMMAMIFLAKECPKNAINTHLSLKKLYDKAEFSFKTTDNLTYEVRLKKEGLNWKIVGWFGVRDKWDNFIKQINLPE